MELLVGYGSGSDSEPGSPQGPSGTAVLLPSSPPRPSAAPVVAPGGADPAQLLSRLPAPSGSKVRLPPPLPPPSACLSSTALASGCPPFRSLFCGNPPAVLRRHAPPLPQQIAAACRPCPPFPLSRLLPPPQAPLFSGLPQPAQKKKVVVQFRVPISFDRSEVDAAEEAVGGVQ